MTAIGDCFVVLAPNCVGETFIFGRNSNAQDEVREMGVAVHYYEANNAVEGKSDGGAEPELTSDTFRMILQKPRPGVWGGDAGANERNVCMGVTWSSQVAEDGSGHLTATDLLRYTLASAVSAEAAVDCLGALVTAHAADNSKFSFVICDSTSAWIVSSGGKLWSAQSFTEGFRRFPGNGLAVTTTIDKSSEGLGDALKTLGLWNGEGDIDFAACFGASSSDAASSAWSGDEPSADGSYTLTSMFDTLRSVSNSTRSSMVSVLTGTGISCHWFTGTPNASESVFKPFVFAPNPKISPLTQVQAAAEDQTITLLHKLHAQRKPAAVADLKDLEAACVEEVNAYLAEHTAADEELDELMKDCVEAEVKFYR